jgi:hypothetical protein
MRTWTLALVMALLVGTVSAAAGAEAVPLALKFAAGDQLTYNATFSGGGSVTAPDGQTSSLDLRGSCTFAQRTVRVNQDGSAEVEVLLPAADLQLSLQGRQVRFSYAGGKVRWFTDGEEQAPPQVDLSTAPLLMRPVTVTVQPDGRMTGLSLPGGQLTELLQQALPGGVPTLPQGNSVPLFADHPVQVGETWEQPLSLPAGPLTGGLTGRSRRTLEEMSGAPGMAVAKVSGFAEVRFQPGQPASIPVGQSVAISVPEMRQTLRSQEFFDVDAGQLVRGDYDLNFTMRVAAAVAGREQTGSIDAHLRVQVTVR